MGGLGGCSVTKSIREDGMGDTNFHTSPSGQKGGQEAFPGHRKTKEETNRKYLLWGEGASCTDWGQAEDLQGPQKVIEASSCRRGSRAGAAPS